MKIKLLLYFFILLLFGPDQKIRLTLLKPYLLNLL